MDFVHLPGSTVLHSLVEIEDHPGVYCTIVEMNGLSPLLSTECSKLETDIQFNDKEPCYFPSIWALSCTFTLCLGQTLEDILLKCEQKSAISCKG
ncbi:hypothetical protein AVEN_32187-1 [Araneus ventricosus]|uniref:Uncharacterized protein n=1 Tax=Araneus ventricosus TaxID=182803 RepID=A0A4Y2U6N8_ARAVE|nr:hypothetical protein AVEN_32187-1 [Araneus ventricosus]